MLSRAGRIPVALLVLILLLAGALAAGCGEAETPAATSAPSAADAVLEVVGPEGSKSYTLEQIKAMPAFEGYGGLKTSAGRIMPPAQWKGVPLEDLLAGVGGLSDDMAVTITAVDGYSMAMSAAQLRAGDFTTFDPVDGAEREIQETLRVVIAYENEGRALDPESEGPLRMVILGGDKSQVTDGHWWVKWVTKLEAKPMEQDWTLTLTGAISDVMDKAKFEAGANPGCHGQEWTDAEGNKWSGIPLYLLVGWVDDEIKHRGPAYNRELAQAGYDVQVIGADGAVATVRSEAMFYVREIIIADRMNGAPLEEEHWPLRLVGEGIPAADMIGRIVEIKALVPPIAPTG